VVLRLAASRVCEFTDARPDARLPNRITCGMRRRAVTPRDRSRAWSAAPRVRPTRSTGVPASKLLLNGRWFPPPASRLRFQAAEPLWLPARDLLGGYWPDAAPATRPPPRARPRANCVPRPAAWLPARNPARRRCQLEHLRPGRERDMPRCRLLLRSTSASTSRRRVSRSTSSAQCLRGDALAFVDQPEQAAAGSMQHGAPLGHEVEEFDGG
jgi:hypothetical protein